VIDVIPGGLAVRELARGVGFAELAALTGVPLADGTGTGKQR